MKSWITYPLQVQCEVRQNVYRVGYDGVENEQVYIAGGKEMQEIVESRLRLYVL